MDEVLGIALHAEPAAEPVRPRKKAEEGEE
jgi:hypothetical protein